MPTLRQFRYLTALADCLNFHKAAEACHVSQPSMSIQIRDLETKLGVELFERTRRKVVLTPIGREVAERARAVLREVQDISDLARSARAPLSGPLRLGVIATLGPYLMPYVLSAFREEHPDLRLYMREDPSRRLERRLKDGDLDVILVDFPVDMDGLDGFALFAEPLWLAVAADHPLAGRPSVKAGDLANTDLLLLEEGHCLRQQVLELAHRVGAREHTGFQATSLDTLRQMVASHIGPTLLPALYVAAEAAQDRQIKVLPITDPVPTRTVGLLWRKRSTRFAEFRELGTFIRTRLPDVVTPFPVAPDAKASL
ncbi:MAG: LysR substrate-binding domain-containing protein [Rhodospirillaceae bacterium]